MDIAWEELNKKPDDISAEKLQVSSFFIYLQENYC